MNVSGYETDFMDAMKFSAGRGFEFPASWTTTTRRFLDDERIQQTLTKLMQESIKQHGRLEVFSANCLGVHWQLRDEINVIVKTKSVLTIGKIRFKNGNKVFDFSREDVIKWTEKGFDNLFNINIHAWLTLPSMEVVDLTFLAGYSLANNRKEYGVIAKHWSEMKGMEYEPVAVGNDIPERFHINPVILPP